MIGSGKGQDAFAAGYHHKYSESVSYRFVSKGNGYLINRQHLVYSLNKLTFTLFQSVTLLEATTPVKLPTKQCPRITR